MVMAVAVATVALWLQEQPVSQFAARTTCLPSLWSRIPSQLCVRRSGRMGSTYHYSVSTAAIADTFAALKHEGKVAFIPYLTAGDPDLDTTAEAIRLLDACGANVIELGVPYSNPIADGPVIQASATRSLAGGTTLDKVLSMLKEVSPSLKCPVVLFTYYNPVRKRGMEPFLKAIKAAGASGLIVPDVPLEETDKLQERSAANALELILLTTPTTPKSRMDTIAKASQGFVYLVSLTGVTGIRASVNGRVEGLLKELKEVTEKPIAVGFGISLPEHATQVVEWGADRVIIGSAIVKILGRLQVPRRGSLPLKSSQK